MGKERDYQALLILYRYQWSKVGKRLYECLEGLLAGLLAIVGGWFFSPHTSGWFGMQRLLTYSKTSIGIGISRIRRILDGVQQQPAR